MKFREKKRFRTRKRGGFKWFKIPQWFTRKNLEPQEVNTNRTDNNIDKEMIKRMFDEEELRKENLRNDEERANYYNSQVNANRTDNNIDEEMIKRMFDEEELRKENLINAEERANYYNSQVNDYYDRKIAIDTKTKNDIQSIQNDVQSIRDEKFEKCGNPNNLVNDMRFSDEAGRVQALQKLERKYKKCCNNFFSARTPYCKQIKKNIVAIDPENSCDQESILYLPTIKGDRVTNPEIINALKAYELKYQKCCPSGYFGMKSRKPICRKLRQLRRETMDRFEYDNAGGKKTRKVKRIKKNV